MLIKNKQYPFFPREELLHYTETVRMLEHMAYK